MTHRRVLIGCLATIVMVSLTGCGSSPYVLRGRVLEGTGVQVTEVSKRDPRMRRDGNLTGSGAVVSLTLDPDSLNAQRLPQAIADREGFFEVPVRATGAGLLLYDIRVIVQRGGSVTADDVLPLPNRGRRLFVTLPPGTSKPPDAEKPDLIQETLDMGRPMLEDRP